MTETNTTVAQYTENCGGKRDVKGMIKAAVQFAAHDMGVAKLDGVVTSAYNFLTVDMADSGVDWSSVTAQEILGEAQDAVGYVLPSYWRKRRAGRERCHESPNLYPSSRQCELYRGHRGAEGSWCRDRYGVPFTGRRLR